MKKQIFKPKVRMQKAKTESQKAKAKGQKVRKFFTFHFLLLTLTLCVATVQAQSNEFTYQGRLLDNSAPATANYDFQFSLWDSLANGTQQGTTQTVTGVAVANGIFTVKLNFGAQFTGAARFIQIAVQPAGGTTYTTLAPRQSITSSPYSIKSSTSTSADGLSVACNLCVTDAHILSIDGAKVTGTVANATTAVNVSSIVPIANGGTGSSTQNFVDLSTNQNVSGNKTFNSAATFDGAVTVAGSNNSLTVDGSLNVGFNVTADQFFGGGDGLFNIPANGLNGIVSVANGGTGSATQNFVDLATSQSVGGNKLFAGTVGVGSNSLDAKLIVASSTTSSGNNTAYFEAPSIGPNASNIHYGTNGDWYIRSAAVVGKVILQDTGGNVGIGTTTPTEKLDVAGNIKFTGTVNGDGSGLTNLNGSNITNGTISESRLGLAGMGFSGRINGLNSAGSSPSGVFGGANGFTNVSSSLVGVQTLSPHRACAAMNLSVRLINSSGVAPVPPGADNSRSITLVISGDTAVACTISGSATSCNSGALTHVNGAGSELAIRIRTTDGGTLNDVGGDTILFGWECR